MDTYLLKLAIQAALNAGEKILEIYYSRDFAIKLKSDNSPLTIADKAAHSIISESLKPSSIPILSEEGTHLPYKERKKWEYLWLVDPLDGTKEFIKRNDEFTVNIALIHFQKPVVGVIYAPVPKSLYFSIHNTGSYRIEKIAAENISNLDHLIRSAAKLPLVQPQKKMFTIIASRSHRNAETDFLISKMKYQYKDVAQISIGSALKFCLIAEGKADFYPRFHRTMEWDTAAGQIISEEAGFSVTQKDGVSPLIYNKENLENPWFMVKQK
ncbi:MAG: 3'(2'),5'-bisphosphate nucleotidase CysQ [Bacteroidia bacterium]|nr:3'(2'),5'-bisphosphate nucleotidase CysQ [Bacteroidia bacterium]